MNNLLAPHNLRSNMLTYLLVRAFLVNVEAPLLHNSRDMGTISKWNINWPKIPVKYVIEYNEKPYRFPIEPNSGNRCSRRRKTLKHHTLWPDVNTTICVANISIGTWPKHTNASHEIVPVSWGNSSYERLQDTWVVKTEESIWINVNYTVLNTR